MRFLSKLVKPIGCRLRLASLSEFDLWERGELLLAENDYALVDSTQLRIRIRTDPSLADLNQMTLGIEDSFLVALVTDLEDPRFMTYAQWKMNCPHTRIEYYLRTPGGEEFMIYGVTGRGVRNDPNPTRRF